MQHIIEELTNEAKQTCTDYLENKVKPLLNKIIECLIQFQPNNPNLYIAKWIENNNILSSNISTTIAPQTQFNNKLYLHKSLIRPESIDHFNFYYSNLFECVLCKDTLFDAVSCTTCNKIFCSALFIILKDGTISISLLFPLYCHNFRL